MMSPEAARWLVMLVTAYGMAGLAFSIAFVAMGLGKIDDVAKNGTVGFRLLILPGVAALWPYLAWRWRHAEIRPVERNVHRDRAAKRRRL